MNVPESIIAVRKLASLIVVLSQGDACMQK